MKNKEFLTPPSKYPTKEGISLAKSRMAYDDYIWRMMYDLINYYNLKEGLVTKNNKQHLTEENVIKQAARVKKSWQDKLSNWVDDDIWEALIDKQHFQTYYIDVLREQHYGACTGIRESCDRCEAEAKLGVRSTVNWTTAQGKYMVQNRDEEYDSTKES